MFGLYTVNVKVCLPDCKYVIYRRCFMSQESAEAFAENIDSLSLEKVNLHDGLTKQDIKGLVTIQDRTQKEYFYKRVPFCWE